MLQQVLYWVLPFLAVGMFAAAYLFMISLMKKSIRKGKDMDALHAMSLRAPTDAVLEDEMKRHPDTPVPGFRWIDVASHSGQLEEAWRRADEVGRRFPHHAELHARRIWLLIRMKRLDEAGAMALKCMKRFPKDSWIHELWIEIADARGDRADAFARAEKIRRDHPADGAGYLYPCRTLVREKRFDEAEPIAAEGVRLIEANHHQRAMREISARIAEHKGDFERSVAHWKALIDLDANNLEAYLGVSRVLRKMSCVDEANDFLRRASVRFENDPRVKAEIESQAV